MVNYLWVMAASLGRIAAALYAIESVLAIYILIEKQYEHSDSVVI